MVEIEEEYCNPNKLCKNMEDITIEYTLEDWKEILKKDGKLQ